MTEENKIYLGDGAYAEFSSYDVRIYHSDGMTDSRGTYLGMRELQALFNALKQRGIEFT